MKYTEEQIWNGLINTSEIFAGVFLLFIILAVIVAILDPFKGHEDE